jgi:hypothetical protein
MSVAKIKHKMDLDCPCKPQVFVLCDECSGNGGACWKCGGEGLVEVDRFHAEENPVAIVVHRDAHEFGVATTEDAIRELQRRQRRRG